MKLTFIRRLRAMLGFNRIAARSVPKRLETYMYMYPAALSGRISSANGIQLEGKRDSMPFLCVWYVEEEICG